MIPRNAAEAAEYLSARAIMAARADAQAAHFVRCAEAERARAADLRADAEQVRLLFPDLKSGDAA